MARNKRGSGLVIQDKYILLILSIVCVIMMVLSYTTNILSGPFEAIAGYTIIPFQKGISYAGNWLSDRSDNVKKMSELMNENDELRKKVDELTIEVNSLSQDKYELAELRQMLELSERYSQYNKVGARVIGKDSGNWYSTFLIDKGSRDGLSVDMNVMAGSGLVGIITEVGPNWSSVKSIINDSSNVSAMVLATSDTMIVSGDLEKFSEGYISFSQLADKENKVVQGDQIVTSHISDKYLPGISIGYITEIVDDSNNLTKSGHITPVVDFEHLDTVLVITELKAGKDTE